MLNKKIMYLLLSTTFLTPAAVAAIEATDPECVEAATNFVAPNSVLDVETASIKPLYGIRPDANGDVNNDGKITINDYTLLRRYIASGNNSNIKINKSNADLNYDGKITVLDLLLLKSLI